MPTTAELGYPTGVERWFAWWRRRHADAVVQRVTADLGEALSCPSSAPGSIELGAEPQGGTTAATTSFIKDEEARWRGVIKSANVTLE